MYMKETLDKRYEEIYVKPAGLDDEGKKLKDLKHKALVTDMDEILVNITPLWYYKILQNKKFYSQYFKEESFIDFSEEPYRILARNVDYLCDFLDIREDCKLSKAKLNTLLMKEFDDPEFYKQCQLTQMGESVRITANQSKFGKIYIVSHTPNDRIEGYKKEFVKQYFNMDSVELICVPLGVKKSEIIKDIDYATFIDDSVKNIIDVLQNTDSEGKEFIMPQLGYNEPTEELRNLIKEKNAKLYAYDTIL